MTASVIFTIGHSNRSLSEFTDILRSANIRTLVDIRRFPASRRFPHFNIGSLADALMSIGIDYRHIPELGGYREQTNTPDLDLNDGWPPGFLRNYADYAMTQDFRLALHRFHQICGRRPALMCAEREWTACHRQIIADYLIADGDKIVHLIDAARQEVGRLTPFTERIEGGAIRYHRSDAQLSFDL